VTDAHPTRAGRHRQARASRLTRLRPTTGSARTLLKSLAVGTTASGVVSALVLPSSAGLASTPTSAELPRNVAVAAPAAQAPATQDSFGLIGFTATAKPAPKPKPKPEPEPVAEPAPEPRTEQRASRSANYSRAGLGMSGMSDNAVAVINEVKRSFPHLDDIGGYRAGDPGDHGTGNAVDVMCGSSDGDALAEHLQGMAGTLNIKYIIWKQRIWYPGGGGWEPMEDRGSATANHYDHVHVSVN
jgi:hypothetical protein